MLRKIVLGLIASVLALSAAAAEPWPSRPIKLVVNFPAGTALDVLARAFGNLLSEQLKQPVVIDNKVGAGGNIGMEAVARSSPDGYTLLWTGGSTLVTNMFLYKSYNAELAKSLEPIAVVYYQPLALVVRENSTFRTASDIEKFAKSHPNQLRYGTSGLGSPMHLSALMWMSQAGFTAEHVPYKSTSESVIGLANGDIDFYFDAGAALPLIRQGRLRSLALAGSSRSTLHGATPTMLEATGAKVDPTLPGGLYAPPKTPQPIIEAVRRAAEVIWKDQRFRDAITPINAEPSATFPSLTQIQNQLTIDRERIGKLVRQANLSID